MSASKVKSVAPTITVKQRSTSFLDLPGELRNRIHSYNLPEDKTLYASSYLRIQLLTRQPFIEVGDQIGREAAPIYYSGIRFSILAEILAHRFVHNLSAEQRTLVRRLEVHSPPYHDKRDMRDMRETLEYPLDDIRELSRSVCTGFPPECLFMRVDWPEVTGGEEWVPLTDVDELEIKQRRGDGCRSGVEVSPEMQALRAETETLSNAEPEAGQ